MARASGRGRVRSANLSGSGVFKDDATDERVRALFFTGEAPAVQVIIPASAPSRGRSQITALEYSGSYNGEATYEMAFASAGALTFTRARHAMTPAVNPCAARWRSR